MQYKPEAIFVVIVVAPSLDPYTTSKRILEICWTRKIVNVIVLPATEAEHQQHIFTFHPFTPFHCERVVPILLAIYTRRSGFIPATVDLFPDKYDNWHRCPLRIATYMYPPSIILRTAENETDIKAFGIDGDLMHSLAKSLNFTSHIVDCKERGIIYSRYNGTGCFGMVLSDYVNMTMGDQGYAVKRLRYLRASRPLYFTRITFGLPPGAPYTPLQKLMQPFRRTLWTLLVTICGTAAAVVWLLNRCTSARRWRSHVLGGDRRPLFTAMTIALGYSVPRQPRRNLARFMFLSWTMLLFVVRNAYQGYLFVVLQRHQRRPRPDTIDELIAANYTIYMEQSSLTVIGGIPQLAHAQLDFYDDPMAAMRLLLRTTADVAYVLSTVCLEYFNWKENRQGESIAIPKDRLIVVPLTLYMGNLSSFRPAFNQQIARFMGAGLMEHWLQRYSPRAIPGTADGLRPEPSKLLMEHMLGTFMGCILMLGVACVVFVGEVVVDRVRRMKEKYSSCATEMCII